MGLQRFKLNISKAVISSENASLSSMGTDKLLDLFHVRTEFIDWILFVMGLSRNGYGHFRRRANVVSYSIFPFIQVGEAKEDEKKNAAAPAPGLRGMLEVRSRERDDKDRVCLLLPTELVVLLCFSFLSLY